MKKISIFTQQNCGSADSGRMETTTIPSIAKQAPELKAILQSAKSIITDALVEATNSVADAVVAAPRGALSKALGVVSGLRGAGVKGVSYDA